MPSNVSGIGTHSAQSVGGERSPLLKPEEGQPRMSERQPPALPEVQAPEVRQGWAVAGGQQDRVERSRVPTAQTSSRSLGRTVRRCEPLSESEGEFQPQPRWLLRSHILAGRSNSYPIPSLRARRSDMGSTLEGISIFTPESHVTAPQSAAGRD